MSSLLLKIFLAEIYIYIRVASLLTAQHCTCMPSSASQLRVVMNLFFFHILLFRGHKKLWGSNLFFHISLIGGHTELWGSRKNYGHHLMKNYKIMGTT